MSTVREKIITALTLFWDKAQSLLIRKANIVDNCASTSTEYPLSANQGTQLQTQIDELNSNLTPDITIVNQSNYTISNIQVIKHSGIVDVHLNITCVVPDTTNWTTIATLPASCLPPTNIYKNMPYHRVSSGYDGIRLRIHTSGAIQIALGSANVAYAFHDTFISS